MSSPNILVFISDQQRADTIAPETACQTPNIDSLSEGGTRFERCYSQSPICSPSRATMLTGVLPHNHGMVDVTHSTEPYRNHLREDMDTWSDHLDDQGYHLGYFGRWHAERSKNLGTFGFDEYETTRQEAFERNFGDYREKLGLAREPDMSPEAIDDPFTVSHAGYDDFLIYGTHDEPAEATPEHYICSRGIDFIEQASDQDQPWCLTLGTYAPHDPFVPPEDYLEQYDPGAIPRRESFDDDMEEKPEMYRRQRDVWEEMEWPEFAEAIAHYYAYCSHVDDQVGRILDTLEETGQREDTIVIFTSDHGELAGAHGMLLKGLPAFDECYRVPFVIDSPFAEASGQVRNEIIRLQDLAPTLVDLGGGEFDATENVSIRNPEVDPDPYPMDDQSNPATSLAPFLDGEVPSDHRSEAFAEIHAQRFPWTQRTLWTDRYKYVFNTVGPDELYDHVNDPHELQNVAQDDEYQDVLVEMATRMWEIARETGDHNIVESGYGMHRFAPVGPNVTKN